METMYKASAVKGTPPKGYIMCFSCFEYFFHNPAGKNISCPKCTGQEYRIEKPPRSARANFTAGNGGRFFPVHPSEVVPKKNRKENIRRTVGFFDKDSDLYKLSKGADFGGIIIPEGMTIKRTSDLAFILGEIKKDVGELWPAYKIALQAKIDEVYRTKRFLSLMKWVLRIKTKGLYKNPGWVSVRLSTNGISQFLTIFKTFFGGLSRICKSHDQLLELVERCNGNQEKALELAKSFVRDEI